jgi:hypothetical protein
MARLGLRRASVHGIYWNAFNEEHIIDPEKASALFPLGGFVFQSHVRGIGRTVEILKAYKVPTIVTCRNLLDSLVSFKESTDFDWQHTRTQKEFVQSTHLGLQLPEWGTMTELDRFRWVTHNMTPWFISFYVSWQEVDIPVHWVWYNEFFRDQIAGLTGIIKFIGAEPVSMAKLEEVSSHWDGKYNCGIAGRGKLLPPDCVEDVYNQIDAWGSYRAQIERDLCGKSA